MKIGFLSLLLILLFTSALNFEEGISRFFKTKKSSERGLYLTIYTAQNFSRFNYLKNRAKQVGLNTLVIDAKSLLSKNLLKDLQEKKSLAEIKITPDLWLTRLTSELHKEGFIVTVRLVVFKDDHLALRRPDLAVKNKSTGGFYRDNKGGRWVDPHSLEVQLYNALLSEIAAASGVDEIQFDYLRFPAEGDLRNAFYPFAQAGISRVEVINSFLEMVKQRVKKYNVSLAVDIFGVTAWQSKHDIESLGQDLKKMAAYLDVLSPMFYPSHFHAGYDGFANPGSHPYYFVNAGVKKAKEILSSEATILVPWIQGFNLRSPNFGPQYLLEQIQAAKDQGIDRYLIWNARNDYEVVFAALRKKKGYD